MTEDILPRVMVAESEDGLLFSTTSVQSSSCHSQLVCTNVFNQTMVVSSTATLNIVGI